MVPADSPTRHTPPGASRSPLCLKPPLHQISWTPRAGLRSPPLPGAIARTTRGRCRAVANGRATQQSPLLNGELLSTERLLGWNWKERLQAPGVVALHSISGCNMQTACSCKAIKPTAKPYAAIDLEVAYSAQLSNFPINNSMFLRGGLSLK